MNLPDTSHIHHPLMQTLEWNIHITATLKLFLSHNLSVCSKQMATNTEGGVSLLHCALRGLVLGVRVHWPLLVFRYIGHHKLV